MNAQQRAEFLACSQQLLEMLDRAQHMSRKLTHMLSGSTEPTEVEARQALIELDFGGADSPFLRSCSGVGSVLAEVVERHIEQAEQEAADASKVWGPVPHDGR